MLDKLSLAQGIKSAFDAQSDVQVDPAVARKNMADALADVIDAYVRAGTVTVHAGVPVSTAGTAVAQTGATTANGIGTIT